MRGLEQTPWLYDAAMWVFEAGPFGRWRRAVVRTARGRVLEVGCGTGRNFTHYSQETRVVGTDPELAVLRKARSRAGGAPLVAARAEALPFRDGAFDAVVSTLVFCSVDDPTAGFHEIRRVLRDGGGLHMLEHVRAESRTGARLQDRVQPLWTRLAGGCRPNRDTVARVANDGFTIEESTFQKKGLLRSFVARPRPAAGPPEAAERHEERPPSGSRREIRRYYRTVGRFIELELASRNDAGYWRARAEELGRPAVLELGAGTGRVTRVLAPLTELLVGIDLSPEMLRMARQRFAGAAGAHLVVADMRTLELGRRFDLVLAANDPFSHLPSDADRDRAMAVVARHLRPGGIFVLDALWFPERFRRRLQRPGGWHRTRELGSPEEECSVEEWWHLDPDTWRGQVRYEYRQKGRTVGTAGFRPRFWRPEEVERRFSAVGLKVRRRLGGYDERPWDPERDRSLIVEAVRVPSEGEPGRRPDAQRLNANQQGGEDDEGPARPTL